VVRLANENGIPNVRAEIPPPSGDVNGGVELRNSKWGFRTLFVPPLFGRMFELGGRPAAVAGQLRIISIAPLTPSGSDAEAGLYVLRIAPAVGLRRYLKTPIAWATGLYQFLVSYTDGDQSGAALGTLTVR
jgi:hypothetical protein